MIKQDISENQAKIAYLSLGSNLGNKKKNIETAKFKLKQNGIKILQCSSNYESISWPNSNFPKYINIVIKVQTFLTPIKLLDVCNLIEIELGRKRLIRNAPRTCDIDIIDYNKIIVQIQKKLILPHPAAHKRNFVLLPLFEISKSWKHPKNNKNIINLIKLLSMKDLRSITQI